MDAFKASNETVLILIQFYYFIRSRSIRRKHETIIVNFTLIGLNRRATSEIYVPYIHGVALEI